MRNSVRVGLAAASMALVMTAACGGDDSGSSTGTTTTAGGSAGSSSGGPGGSGGSGGSGGGATGSADTFEQFYASLVDQICTALGPCCAKEGFDSSGQQCRLLYSSADTSNVDKAAYDPQKGRACLDKLKAVAATGQCEDSGFDLDTDPTCRAALPVKDGNKQPGEACEDDNQCAPVAGAEVSCHRQTEFLEGGGTKETRFCRVERVGKAGDAPCVWTIDGNSKSVSGLSDKEMISEGYTCDVAQGLYCPTGGEACKAFAPNGASCGGGEQCLKTSYCKDGTCAPREAVGSECSFDACVDTAYCDNATKKCAAKLPAGAPCTSSEQCDGVCSNDVCKEGGGLEDFGYALLCGEKK